MSAHAGFADADGVSTFADRVRVCSASPRGEAWRSPGEGFASAVLRQPERLEGPLAPTLSHGERESVRDDSTAACRPDWPPGYPDSPRLLVIGIGNPLRGDDGVGWRVVEAVEARWGSRVRVLRGQQVMPEWAPDLTAADVVYFVDASLGLESAPPRRHGAARAARSPSIEPLQPAPRADAASGSHGLDPAALLRLAQDLYGRAPEAFLVSIPARSFGYGEALSPTADGALRLAIAALHAALAARFATSS